MDGIAADNKNVMILAATNAPWRVDSALRRPGRFDRVIFVPPPDAPAREAILNIHLRDVPVDSVDAAKIAKLTDKFSGADLRALVGRASEQAILLEMKTGAPAKLSQKMFAEAVKGMRPSTVEWLETARNYASYANRAGLYDDLVTYFEKQ
jgi:SpoVK/Ycf46/Vps4 family AAA+-type ATPase